MISKHPLRKGMTTTAFLHAFDIDDRLRRLYTMGFLSKRGKEKDLIAFLPEHRAVLHVEVKMTNDSKQVEKYEVEADEESKTLE